MPTHTKTLGKGIRRERCFKSEQNPFIAQPHQEKVKDYFLNFPHRGLLLYQKLGSGKCHAIDTPIMLNDGKIKMVQDIKLGDLLMGDDSTPRTVTSLARGEDEMYEIIPVKGDSYTVNQEHILCLKASGYPRINHATNYNVQYIENNKFMSKTFSYKKNDTDDEQKKKDEAENFFNNISHDNIMEMSVIEYLKLSKTKKACLKTYRVPVEFPEQKVIIDPYMIGYWLGDGTSNNSQITTEDKEVVNYFEKFCNDNNHRLYQGKRSITTRHDLHYTLYGSIKGKPKSNIFLTSLKENNLINNKHIPDIYKYNSRENRLKLLAGLIDSDGSLYNSCFEFTQSIEKEKLFDDVMYLARSLGFACYKAKKKTICKDKKGNIIEGEAWRMHISGSGIEEIPTKIPRKQAKARKQIKDVLVSGIEVKHVGRDNYYGFTLDGNCRYLLGDFTVTHNTCTSIIIADEMLEKGMIDHVYVCTPGSLRKNFTTEYCDLCGDQEKLKDDFTFITYNTNIFKSIQKLDFNNSLVIIDEAHNLINGAKNITKNPYALYNQILNSNAKVLVLTATILYNNIYEWCLLGNLLKVDTFPNIIENSELNISLFEENFHKIFSNKNLEGIISYYPGFDKDYPDVIYNDPIIVPMTLSQGTQWYNIQQVEHLRRGKGPPKPQEYRKNKIDAQKKHTLYIMAQKYILSRAISNVQYLSFMIRKELNEDEKKTVEYYLKHFFEKKKYNPSEENEDDHEDEDEDENFTKFIKIKKTVKQQEFLIDLIKVIIKEIHIMAPTYTDIINLDMTYGQIKEHVEKNLIDKKLTSKKELDEINFIGVIKMELYKMKKNEEEEVSEEKVDEIEVDEEVDEGEEDDYDYCKNCKESLKINNINSRKSYYKWALKNHPDKKQNKTSEDLALFQEISSCYNDWTKDSKCPKIMNDNILFDIEEDIHVSEEDVEEEDVEEEDVEEEKIFNICNICYQPLKTGPNLIYKLACGDVFHYDCIKEYVKNTTHIENKKCPVCGIYIEGKINKQNAKPYQYKVVSDTFVEDGGWINKDIFHNKLLMVISPKILTIVLNILKNYNSKHFIFSFFLEKAGLKLISNILKMCGINTILYHGDLTPETRSNLLKKFNKKNNIYGEKFKVFLSTEAGYEGITLKEVGHVHFLETNTIPNKTVQAIGRAVRYKSHILLPIDKRNVNIWKYFSTYITYKGKIKDFDTFNLDLNTFDEYYEYYVKSGFINYLNEKYGENSLNFEAGTDELLNNKGDYKVEEFKEFYNILQENSIEKTGVIDKYKKEEKKGEEESKVLPLILQEDEEVVEED